MSSKHSQGQGSGRDRDRDRDYDRRQDSDRGRDRDKREDRDRPPRSDPRSRDDGDRGKEQERGVRPKSAPAHQSDRARDRDRDRGGDRDGDRGQTSRGHSRGAGSRSPARAGRDQRDRYPSGGTPGAKGSTPGPKPNTLLVELLRHAKAKQGEGERGPGQGSAPASASGSDGDGPEAGEIVAPGADGGKKRRYHSPIVWNPDGGKGDGDAGGRPAKRPAAVSAVDRAAEELAAFRRAQAQADLDYDPEGPPAVKGTPSNSMGGSDSDDGGRHRSVSAGAGRGAEQGARSGGGRGPLDSDAESEGSEGAAARPAGGNRWLADAGGAADGGSDDGGARERGGGGASPSPRRGNSAAPGGGGARGGSSSRSPEAEGRGGEEGGEGEEPLVSAQITAMAECRSVDEYERLNRISEGTYGVVFRARCKKTGRICALKKIKMEKERDGFPVTSIREINILLNLHHPNIVNVSEVVMGSRLDQIFMVMEFMDHDLKSLMNDKSQMTRSFSVAEVKCLMLQILSGMEYLHENWVIHRDLKTSNILYNNRGELKICDFGLARQYGSPLRPYTQPVVTLWYRPPELLLGATHYSTAVDVWSLGCIMAELLTGKPLFDGQGEIEQLDKICSVLGTPNEDVWPGLRQLPNWGKIVLRPQPSQLRARFTSSFGSGATLTEAGFDLLSRLLAYDPADRISCADAMKHKWFQETPFPQRRELMPTFRSNKDGVGPVRQAAVGAASPVLNFISAALKAR
ncbi:hypothetical protein HYH03_007412 [Edaphochlamys debaryana]|uniref:Protein kinase domain-containing protein n=1 Tax=Edaphochlamys debaryana TaxID=47281 RepID=A0A835Y1W2_9CHLO|nr:hypothetical protein HYH03_007412 [Edaphochlamys debaryana]|eukprot:KAG2494355.1 hypothetical protein HYH03_007412 [Edaphochlamys debaryana]